MHRALLEQVLKAQPEHKEQTELKAHKVLPEQAHKEPQVLKVLPDLAVAYKEHKVLPELVRKELPEPELKAQQEPKVLLVLVAAYKEHRAYKVQLAAKVLQVRKELLEQVVKEPQVLKELPEPALKAQQDRKALQVLKEQQEQVGAPLYPVVPVTWPSSAQVEMSQPTLVGHPMWLFGPVLANM